MSDMTLTELKSEVEKLMSLLDDPQPGLSTWHTFVSLRLIAINKAYEKGFIVEKGTVSNAKPTPRPMGSDTSDN